jgi:hypothetical protein
VFRLRLFDPKRFILNIVTLQAAPRQSSGRMSDAAVQLSLEEGNLPAIDQVEAQIAKELQDFEYQSRAIKVWFCFVFVLSESLHSSLCMHRMRCSNRLEVYKTLN